MTAEQQYLIWSDYHGAWWGPNRSGYTDKASAGRYTLAEAERICGRTEPERARMELAPPADRAPCSECDGLRQDADQLREQVAYLSDMGNVYRDIMNERTAMLDTTTDEVGSLRAELARLESHGAYMVKVRQLRETQAELETMTEAHAEAMAHAVTLRDNADRLASDNGELGDEIERLCLVIKGVRARMTTAAEIVRKSDGNLAPALRDRVLELLAGADGE